MGKSRNISQYRERLDRTLALPELINHDALKTLVRNQLLRSSLNENEVCSENVIEKRATEVSYFLDMLRSASVSENDVSKTTEKSQCEWKLKSDNEEFRVMYRQGPLGTPFHTLLVEGYVDGPVDACLCISLESTLYKKWWPQISFPPFKITLCKCLQKVRMGEQISLVRVKVTWPLSAREAVVNFFSFEYLQDDLIVVLMNTISDLESIDRTTHGFTKDGIPEAEDVVRIDLVGGFAIQKVTSERSYFRTIANMDVKLDFVPPSLINFISRQLVGNGFRLYQKAVASVSNHDEDYSQALEDPMYARIRKALYSIEEPNKTMQGEEHKSDAFLLQQEHSIGVVQKNLGAMKQNDHGDDDGSELLPHKVLDLKAVGDIEEDNNEENTDSGGDVRGMEGEVNSNDHVSEILQSNALVTERKAFGEIEEEESDDTRHLEKGVKDIDQTSTYKIAQMSLANNKRNIHISTEVEQALETLENAISMVRQYGFNTLARSSFSSTSEETPNLEEGAENDSNLLEEAAICSKPEVSIDVSEEGRTVERNSHDYRNSSSNRDIRRAGSNTCTREGNHNRIAPASPEQCLSIQIETDQVFSQSGIADVPSVVPATQDKQMNIDINGIHENGLRDGKKLSGGKKHTFCCFALSHR